MVAAVLCSNPGFKLSTALPNWPRRGIPQFNLGQLFVDFTVAHRSFHFLGSQVVRVDPVLDHATGFFVALFERVKPGEAAPPPPIVTPAATQPKDEASKTDVPPAKAPRQKHKNNKKRHRLMKERQAARAAEQEEGGGSEEPAFTAKRGKHSTKPAHSAK